ncbi:MAG: glutathione S-transferase family protein [Pseudomonadota bacterium]|nr:glutathione S-transferase family protein [Pseudomonadota bacterium]
MLIVHQPPPVWGLASAGPFCVKLQAWLRLAGIPYDVGAADPHKGPKGKVPWIEDGGVRLGDSELIIAHLAAKHRVDLDGWLDPRQQATARLVRRTLEEATYFSLVYSRWIEDENWTHYAPYFLGLFPPVVGSVVVPMIRRKVRAALHAQGTGRHARDDIHAMANADFDAVATILGDNVYLLGERPSSVDATVYAFTHSILAFPRETPISSHVRTHPALVAYVDRFHARYFPPTELAPR